MKAARKILPDKRGAYKLFERGCLFQDFQYMENIIIHISVFIYTVQCSLIYKEGQG